MPGGFWRQAIVVLSVALAARVIVLMFHTPALSDDVYRYAFDGQNIERGLNPYLNDPVDRIEALANQDDERWPGERALVRLLAYPEVTTPYLPVSHYVFGGISRLIPEAVQNPAQQALAFRIAFVVIECVLMAILLLALRARGLPAWWLALYAWHPLPMSEFAGSGHQDVIGITLLAGALHLATRPRTSATFLSSEPAKRDIGAWSALLAMSAMVKPLTVLAAPLILRRLRWRGGRQWLIALVVGVIACTILAIPLGWWPGQPAFISWKATADLMIEKWAHFGGVYEPALCAVRHAMPDPTAGDTGFNLVQETAARRIALGIFAMAAILVFALARDAWRAVAATLLALTLCSTTCHPWYLLWAFALAPLAMSWTLWTYSLAVAWGYVVFVSGKDHALGVEWTTQFQTLIAAHGLVLLGLLADLTGMLKRRFFHFKKDFDFNPFLDCGLDDAGDFASHAAFASSPVRHRTHACL